MIPKRLEDITEDDITDLVTNSTAETRTLEFKRALHGSTDSDKKEFLADVSSFANAAGGDIIFGVAATDGIADEVPGLADFNEDKETLRLESILRDGLDPRLPGCVFHKIDMQTDNPVWILRVPRSWFGPHRVHAKGTSRFWALHRI